MSVRPGKEDVVRSNRPWDSEESLTEYNFVTYVRCLPKINEKTWSLSQDAHVRLKPKYVVENKECHEAQ